MTQCPLIYHTTDDYACGAEIPSLPAGAYPAALAKACGCQTLYWLGVPCSYGECAGVLDSPAAGSPSLFPAVAPVAQVLVSFEILPALPREMNGRVSYDWQNDTFRLARGDAGLTETRLGEITELGGGRVQVAGALVSLEDESVLCSFTVDLVRNNSMFGYAISGLDIL